METASYHEGQLPTPDKAKEIHDLPGAPQVFEVFKDHPFSFFLDSGMDHEKLGHYSFMGSDPFLVMRSRSEQVTLIRSNGMQERRYRATLVQ